MKQGSLQLPDQEVHRLDRTHLVQDAAEEVDLEDLVLAEEQLLAARRGFLRPAW